MNEDTQAASQPQTPPTPVENQPVAETQPAQATPVAQTPTEEVKKAVNPLMKRVDTLMGLGVIGIALSATLLAFALFANLY
jgi:hypothetical protein